MRRAPLRALSVLAVTAAVALASTGAGATALSSLQTQIDAANATVAVPAHTTPALAPLEPYRTFSLWYLLRHCTPTSSQTTAPLCTFGDTKATTTVVLYGNSEAQAWAPAFNRLGLADKFKLIVIAKPACGTLLDAGYLDPQDRIGSTCFRFDAWATGRIDALNPALLVIATTPGNVLRPGTSAKQFAVGTQVPSKDVTTTWPSRTATDLSRFLATSDVAKSRVVVLGAVPTSYAFISSDEAPSVCLLANMKSMRVCSMAMPTVGTDAWESALSAASIHAGVTMVDVSSLMCSGGLCPLVIHGTLVHFNTLHLTSAFTSYVAPALGELLGNQLP